MYDKTLLEALKAPLFMAYHDGQPFNDNMLRPCPMLENPEKLRDMVKKSGAKSTDMQSPEDVDNLYGKCKALRRQSGPPPPTTCGAAPTAAPAARAAPAPGRNKPLNLHIRFRP